MTKKHSVIGASSATRWFACPGSVRLSEQVPPREDSMFSVQGSAAHAALEDYFSKLEKDVVVDLYDYIGWEFTKGDNSYELTSEDVDSMAEYVEAVNKEREKGKFVMHTEARFSLDRIHPGLFGTADTVLMASDMSKLIVMDYKHGAGIPVEVEDNKQLKYYALGAIEYVCKTHKIDYLDMLGWGKVFKEVEIVIVQPRCRHVDGSVRRWTVSGSALDDFAEELAERAKATADPNAPTIPGNHCRFCPALAICPGFADRTFEIAKADFKGASDAQNFRLPAPEKLSMQEIAKVLRFEPLMTEWLKAVASYAQHCLEHGENVPGFKLVQKRANRKWTDQAEAEAALEMIVKDPDDLYKKTFISPAQAEKLLGKKAKDIVGTLVTHPEGGVTIAPDHDPREAVPGSAVLDFEQRMDQAIVDSIIK